MTDTTSQPTMEQILASIRKIMAEEEAQQAAGVLDLTNVVEPDGSVTTLPPSPSPEVTMAKVDEVTTSQLSPSPDAAVASSSEPVVSDSGTPAPAAQMSEVVAPVSPVEVSQTAQDLPAAVESAATTPPTSPQAVPLASEAGMPSVSGTPEEPAASVSEVGTTNESLSDALFTKSESPAVSPEPLTAPAAPQPPLNPEEFSGLLSEQSVAAGVAAMSTLVVAAQQSSSLTKTVAGEDGIGQKTLEQLMYSLLRPLLSEWLNKHLPGIVEKIVSQEVEKITKRLQG
jgi:cell pole-organizing protein PopZ